MRATRSSAAEFQVGAVAPDGTWNASLAVTLPLTPLSTPLYAIVVADALDVIEEGFG